MLAALPLLVILAALGIAGPPPPVEPTAAERAEIDGGKVVVRWDPDEGGKVTGIVDIAAPVDRVLDEALDLQGRASDMRAVKQVTVYEGDPHATRMAARWDSAVIGISITFHVIYEIDRDGGWITYSLDRSMENDILAAEGSFQAYAAGTRTRLVYRSASDSGRHTPRWIERWLAVEGLTAQLEGIKRRAESP